MTLFTRLGRLLRADLNAVLDQLEEPVSLLRQAVRDMQAALDEEHSVAARLRDEAQRVAQALQECQQRLPGLDEELSLCLSAGQEPLARELVRRKLETTRHIEQLTERQQALEARQQQLALRIAEHAQRLQATRDQARLHDSLQAAAGEEAKGDAGHVAPVSAADIEVALLRERQRRAQS